MVRLHLLGFTPDLKGLVFSGRRGGKSGTYWVPVDDKFAEAMAQLEEARADEEASKRRKKSRKKGAAAEVGPADALQIEASKGLAVTDTQDLPLPEPTSKIDSKLSPREIQKLLREGKSVRQVAKEADVDESWVERFMGPIREEKGVVIRRTQAGVQERPRLGRSSVPIGRAVIRNLEDRKATADTMDEIEDGWDARRVRPKTWRVRLRFTHRGKRRTAEWEMHSDTEEVQPRNKLAKDIGWWSGKQGSGSTSPASGTKKKASKKKSSKEKKTPKKKATKKKASAKKKRSARKRRS